MLKFSVIIQSVPLKFTKYSLNFSFLREAHFFKITSDFTSRAIDSTRNDKSNEILLRAHLGFLVVNNVVEINEYRCPFFMIYPVYTGAALAWFTT